MHNRVENIDYMASHLRSLVPEAKIAIAHGQMKEHELEDVMRDFIEKRINVLICSAIIESGLDIPNANTMIINRADHFGLAQLYQLRGRVGRSRQRKAYAYLLIPGEHIITRDAKRRIEALRELVEAEGGGGFKLAMRDLEHRGAGNLLGHEQSGEIAAVGFELYTEMMEEAIRELRGQPESPRLRARVANRGARVHSRSLRSRRERAAGALSADARAQQSRRISTNCATRCAIALDRCRR